MSDLAPCGHCGTFVAKDTLKGADHAPELRLCEPCRAAIALAGGHKQPLDPECNPRLQGGKS